MDFLGIRSNKTKLSHLCQYVCRYWPHLTRSPIELQYTAQQLEDTRDRQQYLRSIDSTTGRISTRVTHSTLY